MEHKEYTPTTILCSPTQSHAVLWTTRRKRSKRLYKVYNSKIRWQKKKLSGAQKSHASAKLETYLIDLINHSLVGASYDEPLLRNHYQAFRLIVRDVGTITSLSVPKWLWWKRDPNVSAYIMSNPPLSCPFFFSPPKHEENAALVKSSWSCYVRPTAGGTPTPRACAHTYTQLLQKN